MTRRQFTAAALAAGLSLHVRGDDPARKLCVAIIGHTGRGDYGHGVNTMWLGIPETEIVAVADAGAGAAGLAAMAAKLKITATFDDYRKMLTETKPDMVAICMRHIDQHRDAVVAAAETGVRGIYMEKPFCRTPAEADEIIAACEKYKVKVALAHRARMHAVLPVVSGLVKDGAIGTLLELRARGKEDERGGSLDLWVLGSHLLNLATYLAGKPLACSATVLQGGHVVTRADVKEGAEGVGPLAGNEVHARYEMESGVPLYFDSVQNAGVKSAGFGLQLIGTKGIIDFRSDTEPLAQFLEGNPFQPVKEPRTWTPISSAGVGKPEPKPELSKDSTSHRTGARDLIAAMREERQPLCSAYDGRVIVEMISAVFESQRLNGQRVTFPLTTRGNPFALM